MLTSPLLPTLSPSVLAAAAFLGLAALTSVLVILIHLAHRLAR